jgi:hypothetical protein
MVQVTTAPGLTVCFSWSVFLECRDTGGNYMLRGVIACIRVRVKADGMCRACSTHLTGDMCFRTFNLSKRPTWHTNFLFYNKFITVLYMFGALLCSSSGGQIVLIQHLVSSFCVGDRPLHRLCTGRSPT